MIRERKVRSAVVCIALVGLWASCGKAPPPKPSAPPQPAGAAAPEASPVPPAVSTVSSAPASSPRAREVRAGVWGGEHLSLTVSGRSAHFEFDCASGDAVGPIVLDGEGRFTVVGTFAAESGGAVREDDVSVRRRAVYSGLVTADTMTVDVKLVDSNERVGSFAVALGKATRLRKCRD